MSDSLCDLCRARPYEIQYHVDEDKPKKVCSPCYGSRSPLQLDLALGVRQKDYGLQQAEADAAFARIDS